MNNFNTSNSDEFKAQAQSPLFVELSNTELEATKGGMSAFPSSRRRSSYLMPIYFFAWFLSSFNNNRFGSGSSQPQGDQDNDSITAFNSSNIIGNNNIFNIINLG